ncbi:MAG: DoxX family protein [Balneolales bacterium]
MNLSFLDRYQDFGLLIIRIGIGIAYMFHGFPKLFSGPERWESLGEATYHVGIDFIPVFWGFIGASAEFFGGVLLILGLFFRPATIALFLTMAVATASHLGSGDPFTVFSHPLKMAILFFGLFFMGPGRHSMDRKIIFQVRR